jgi:hypothetical protein
MAPTRGNIRALLARHQISTVLIKEELHKNTITYRVRKHRVHAARHLVNEHCPVGATFIVKPIRFWNLWLGYELL